MYVVELEKEVKDDPLVTKVDNWIERLWFQYWIILH